MFAVIISKLLKPSSKLTRENSCKNIFLLLLPINKWGVINSNGEEVITPSYDEMVVVPNKDKAVFIVTYDVDYTNGTYKTKAVNEKNENSYSQIIQKVWKQFKITISKTIYGMKKLA